MKTMAGPRMLLSGQADQFMSIFGQIILLTLYLEARVIC